MSWDDDTQTDNAPSKTAKHVVPVCVLAALLRKMTEPGSAE